MKKVSKLMAMALALFMVLSLAAPAKADNYTAVTGGTTTFDKYFVLDDEADVPGVVFDYTIEGTAGKTYSAGSEMEVIDTTAAPHNTMPVMYQSNLTAPVAAADQDKLTFVQGEGKTASKDINDWLDLPTGKQFVKRTMVVDFTGVTFDEPGIYRYKITENQPSTPALTGLEYDTQRGDNATQCVRYLDVYVIDNNGSLVVQTYVLHEEDSIIGVTGDYGSLSEKATKWEFNGQPYTTYAEAETAAKAAVTQNTTDLTKYNYNGKTFNSQDDAEAAAIADIKITAVELKDKSAGFVNEYTTYDLEFGKEVEGNQGSKDKYFEFTLTLTIPATLSTDTVFQLDVETKAEKAPLANSATIHDKDDMKAANSRDDDDVADGQQLVVPAGDTSITVKFYLKDGQYIAIKGLPVDTVYEITEAAEDYKPTEGTVIGTKQVLATIGDALDNKHQDAVSGTIGGKDKYVKDDAGMFWKDGSDYKELTDVSGTLYVTYTDDSDPSNDVVYDKATHGDRYKLNDQNVYTGYTNTRGGVIPTGVILAAVPGTILAGGALVYLFGKKRHEDEE